MNRSTGPGVVHRIAVVAALIVIVVIGVVVDQASTDRQPSRIPDQVDIAQVGAATYGDPTDVARNRSIPVASRLGAASSTWFCGGAPSADTTIMLTNRSSGTRSVTLTAVTSKRGRDSRRETIPAASTREFSIDDSLAGTVGVVVEAHRGGVVATQRIAGAGSVTLAPCAATSASEWFFAGGDTQKGSAETLVLFNPFDDLATADVAFLTADGFRHPQSTQGLAVPGRSVVLVDVAQTQNRRRDLGAAVTTRAGRIVAWRHQSFDGSGPKLGRAAPPKGVSLTLGAPTPLARFTLPTAVTGEGVTPRVIIANPGATASTVRVSFAVDDPAANGQPTETTVELVSGAVHVLGAEELRGVAAGVPFNVSGRVVSGGSVVAELWMDGTEPARGHGSFATVGIGLADRQWILPAGLPLPVLDQLGIQATGKAADVKVWAFVDGRRRRLALGSQPQHVAASGRVTVDLAKVLKASPGATILVESTVPITASRLQTGRDENGLVSVTGVPIMPGLAGL